MAARRERAEKASLLERFRGPLRARDDEVVEHWRSLPASAHAEAMITLSRMAETIAAHTGYGKDPDELFPGFPTVRGTASREA
jgi:hypothetical protein